MKALALPKSLLIRQPWEYRKVYQVGKRLRSPRLTLIYFANGGTDCRLGISIHGIKTAVRRNRIKRVIREFFRLNRHFIAPPVDVVFAVRPGFEQDSPQEVKQLVERMLLGTMAGSDLRQLGGTGAQSPRVVPGPLGVPE